eukprot:UN2360
MVLRRLRDHFTSLQVSQLAAGIAFCIPVTCSKQEEVMRVAMAFLVCMAARNCADVQHIEDPHWHGEINVSFDASMSSLVPPLGQDTSATQCGALEELPSTRGCGRDFIDRMQELVSVAGTLWTSLDDDQHTDVRWRCSELNGVFARLQFDILAYISRGLSEQVSDEAEAALRRLKSFYTSWANPTKVSNVDQHVNMLCVNMLCGFHIDGIPVL